MAFCELVIFLAVNANRGGSLTILSSNAISTWVDLRCNSFKETVSPLDIIAAPAATNIIAYGASIIASGCRFSVSHEVLFQHRQKMKRAAQECYVAADGPVRMQGHLSSD